MAKDRFVPVAKKQHDCFFAMLREAGCPEKRTERIAWINRWRNERGLAPIKSTSELDAAAKSEMQRDIDPNKNKEW